MTPTADLPQDLVERAMGLPPDGRERLGRLLLSSVAEANATRELIRSRVDDVVSGRVPLLDWRQSLDRLEAEFRGKHPQ